MKSLF